MSHIATVQIEVRDLDVLNEACKRIGLELVHCQQTYRWYGKRVGDEPLPEGFTEADLGQCIHAIRVPADHPIRQEYGDDCYEIGVVKRRDGRPGYSLMWDFYCGGFGLQDIVGEDCNTLKQSYALCAARRQAQLQGFQVQEQPGENGAVRLVLSK